MAETMIDELKDRLIVHMERTRSVAQSYAAQGLLALAHNEWGYYYGLDWVLDTIAELEIKDATERS